MQSQIRYEPDELPMLCPAVYIRAIIDLRFVEKYLCFERGWTGRNDNFVAETDKKRTIGAMIIRNPGKKYPAARKQCRAFSNNWCCYRYENGTSRRNRQSENLFFGAVRASSENALRTTRPKKENR